MFFDIPVYNEAIWHTTNVLVVNGTRLRERRFPWTVASEVYRECIVSGVVPTETLQCAGNGVLGVYHQFKAWQRLHRGRTPTVLVAVPAALWHTNVPDGHCGVRLPSWWMCSWHCFTFTSIASNRSVNRLTVPRCALFHPRATATRRGCSASSQVGTSAVRRPGAFSTRIAASDTATCRRLSRCCAQWEVCACRLRQDRSTRSVRGT